MQDRFKQPFTRALFSIKIAELRQILSFAMGRAAQARTLQLSSSLTFTTVLATVPLLAVVLSLFTAFPLFKEFSDALQDFLTNSLMPTAISENVMSYLNEFALQASRLTIIGGGALLFTVVSLIMSVEAALNTIWRVDRQRRFAHRVVVYWAVITLGPVVAGASLYTTALLARESLGFLVDLPILLEVAFKLSPLLLGGIGIAALFIVVPNTRVNRADALIGGLISALILETMKIGFAYYIAQFSTYTVVYGAFAALPVFLIWVYLCWLGILVGALVAANLPLIRIGEFNQREKPGAALMDALSILKLLSQARGALPPGVSALELIKHLGLPLNTLERRLNCLTSMGLITVAPDAQSERWLLACDPERATLGPLVDQLALDRNAINLQKQPFLANALSNLVQYQTDPTLAEVLRHHDNTLTHPLQSKYLSSNAGDEHVKSQ